MKRSLAAFALLAGVACAQDRAPLIERINAYRSAPQQCQGRHSAAVGPLAPAGSLDRVEIGSPQEPLQDALRRAGYTASRAQVIVLSGPPAPAPRWACSGSATARR